MAEESQQLIIEIDEQNQWRQLSAAGECLLEAGSASELLEQLAGQSVTTRRACLVLADRWVSQHWVEFTEAEKRLLAKTVPYSLEDEVAEELDELHFALGRADAGKVDVRVVASGLMQELIEQAEVAGLVLEGIYCRQDLLPESSDAVEIRIKDDCVQLRTPELASVVFGIRQLPAVLATLGEARSLRLVGAGAEQLALPADWQAHLVETSTSSGFDWSARSQAVDLLQGAFSRAVNWAKFWQAWRWPVLAIAVVFSSVVVQSWLEVRQLEADNLRYRQGIEQAYREAFPRGRIVNPVAQMRTKLAELRGGDSSGGSNLTSLLAVLAADASAASIQISNISYESRGAELRLDILVDSFQTIERLRSSLAERGINAELQTSNAVDGKVRARVQLKEAGDA